MEINYGNSRNLELYFSFIGSGLAKIIKMSNGNLFAPKKLKQENFQSRISLGKYYK